METLQQDLEQMTDAELDRVAAVEVLGARVDTNPLFLGNPWRPTNDMNDAWRLFQKVDYEKLKEALIGAFGYDHCMRFLLSEDGPKAARHFTVAAIRAKRAQT